MSSIDKSIIPTVEAADIESIDFGEPDLNEAFKNLDRDSQQKILKLKKEFQIGVLKSTIDPELRELWETLSEDIQTKLNSIGIRDKYRFLKKMLDDKKAKEKVAEESTAKVFTPKSPSSPPPPVFKPKSPEGPPPPVFKPKSPDEPPPRKSSAKVSTHEVFEAPQEIFAEEEEETQDRPYWNYEPPARVPKPGAKPTHEVEPVEED
jgi:hypothetical protein